MGAYFCKRRILHEVQKNRKGIVRLVVIGSSLGLVLQLVMSLADGLPSWGEAVVLFVGAPLLTLGYIGALALYTRIKRGKRCWIYFLIPENGLHQLFASIDPLRIDLLQLRIGVVWKDRTDLADGDGCRHFALQPSAGSG